MFCIFGTKAPEFERWSLSLTVWFCLCM